MHRQSSEGEWHRRKEYLHPFIEQPLLSPIPEHRESTASPHPVVARLEAHSPLPDLIIEKQQRYIYEDETEEFYNRLEVKMKRLYRKIFLGEDIDIEDVSDNSEPDESRGLEEIAADSGAAKDFLEEDASDDSESKEEIAKDDETAKDFLEDDVSDGSRGNEEIGGDDGAGIDVPEDDASFTEPLVTAEDAGSENSSEGVGEISTAKSVFGKTQESREETDARSEPSNTTSSETHEKTKNTQEKLANIRGTIFSLRSSEEHVSENEEKTSLSQTYTQKPDQSEETSSTKSLQSVSESSGAIVETQTVHAMIHAEKKDAEEEEHQPEIMRRQATHSLEDSFVRAEYSKDERLDLNIEYSMEESPINAVASRKRSVPVEYEFDLPTRSPLREISPVLRLNWKRPATTQLFNFSAKKRKKNNQEEIGERSDEDKENFRDVATETVMDSSNKEIQVDIPMASIHANTQTVFQEKKDVDTEICIEHVDAGMQTDEDSHWVQCRNIASQTTERETNDQASQTTERETNDQETQTRRGLEFYRLFDGVNFFFIF